MERIYVIFNRIIIRGARIALLGAVVITLLGAGKSDIPPKFAGKKLPEGILFFEDEGQDHADPGAHVTYKTDPPTSGSHYDKWAPAGIYEAGEIRPELIVHNLEHGNIVIYFDRSVLSKADMDELIALPKKYAGQWDGVLLVDRKNKENPIILTAWRVILPLKGYDKEKVLNFLDIFRGRGPEKAVR